MLPCPRFRRISPLVMWLFLAGCASGQLDPPDGILIDLAPPHEAAPDGLDGSVDVGSFDGSPLDAPRPDLAMPDLAPPDQAPPPDLPSTPDSGPLLPTAPFTLTFETSVGGLTGTRDWEWGKIAFVAGPNCDSTPKPPTAGHSGTGMWGTKLNDCYSPLGNASSTCSNSDTTDDSILSFKVKIPSNWTSASMTFWEWFDLFLTFDWGEIRVDGVAVNQNCTGSKAVPVVWTQKTINMTPYIGKTVTVAFHMMATSVIQYAGWYIDDLSITGN